MEQNGWKVFDRGVSTLLKHGAKPRAALLWMYLLYRWNRSARKEWIAIPESEALEGSGLGRNTFLKARRELIDLGLLEYKKANIGHYPRYKVNCQ